MRFADPGALFAYATPDDEHHQEARHWILQSNVPPVTADYVIEETLTLMRARSQTKRAIVSANCYYVDAGYTGEAAAEAAEGKEIMLEVVKLHTRSEGSFCCRADGWSNAVLRGLLCSGGWQETMSGCLRRWWVCTLQLSLCSWLLV